MDRPRFDQLVSDMSCPRCHKRGQVHLESQDRYRPRLRIPGLKHSHIPLPYTNEHPKYHCYDCGQGFNDDRRI